MAHPDDNTAPLVRPGDPRTPQVTICIPHYQVEDLMRLCLRAIRKYTDAPTYEVIVVDNGSKNQSLDWLRSLSWIHLVDRGEDTPEDWVLAMNTALDIGLARARGQYYLIMHSDTIPRREGWLTRMVEAIETDPNHAAAGSEKLERRSPVAQFLRDVTDTKRARLWLREKLLGQQSARPTKREPCPRDYCALYRTAILREHNLSFISRRGLSAGDIMYHDLKERGHTAQLIPVPEMMRHVDHIAHATGGIVPKRELEDKHILRKTRKRLRKLFNRDDVPDLLSDDSLEQ